MLPQPCRTFFEVQLESNSPSALVWSIQQGPTIFALDIGLLSRPVWLLLAAGSLHVSSMPSCPKAVAHKIWNCPPDPPTRAHRSTTQALLRSKSTTHLERTSWTSSTLKQPKMAVVGRWPKTPPKKSFSSASEALHFTLHAILSSFNSLTKLRYYPSSSVVEGNVRRSSGAYYSFSWSKSGRNHCSTKLSKNDLADLINNHAMRDIVNGRRECAIYHIDNSGTFHGTLKTAFCRGGHCYDYCWKY